VRNEKLKVNYQKISIRVFKNMIKTSVSLILIIWFFFASCYEHHTRRPAIYYLDAISGNDINPGTSPDKPWKTTDRISSLKLEAGDQVLLKAGQLFPGSIRLKNLVGQEIAPIILASYGGGRAIIDSGDSLAICADSCSYLYCKNLILKGSGRLAGNKTDGILFRQVSHGSIDSVEASGYLFSGIHIVGGSDLSVTHAYAHDNGFCGIYAESGASEYGTDGTAFKTLKHIYIAHSVAENNPGCPAIQDNHSGNGILIAGVVNGLIEYCEAMGNGWDMPREGNGPVGIWTYMSDSITIQHCYAHHNKTSLHGKDGGGFDFDGGIRYSVMQYNLSAFNEGAGYGIFQYAGATEWSGNVIRYNISYNDGSKNSRAGIFMWCDPAAQPMKTFHAYNNTIVTSKGLGVNFEPGHYKNFIFENNIFLITGPTEKFTDGQYTGAVFDNNLYWSAYGDSLKKPQPLRPYDVHALQADPEMILPGNGTLSGLKPEAMKTIAAFKLQPNSPARLVGKNIPHNGEYDFWSNPLRQSAKVSLGAWQAH
jgi:hypothetical protein